MIIYEVVIKRFRVRILKDLDLVRVGQQLTDLRAASFLKRRLTIKQDLHTRTSCFF